jgi:hypothetical protein
MIKPTGNKDCRTDVKKPKETSSLVLTLIFPPSIRVKLQANTRLVYVYVYDYRSRTSMVRLESLEEHS